MKRFLFAFIAAYIFMFAWGYLLNGVVLKDVYAETPFPGKLLVYGSMGGLVEMVIIGAIVGAVYRPGSTASGASV